MPSGPQTCLLYLQRPPRLVVWQPYFMPCFLFSGFSQYAQPMWLAGRHLMEPGFQKNIAAFFLSPPPIAPRAGGHQSNCVPSLPAYSGSECLTCAVAIGSFLRVASLLRALLSSPVKWESRILRAETHLTAYGAEGEVGRGPGGHLGQRAARPPFRDLL